MIKGQNQLDTLTPSPQEDLVMMSWKCGIRRITCIRSCSGYMIIKISTPGLNNQSTSDSDGGLVPVLSTDNISTT